MLDKNWPLAIHQWSVSKQKLVTDIQFISGPRSNRNRVCSNINWSLTHWQFVSGACSNRNRVCSNRNWSLAIHQWSVFKQKQSMFQQKLVTGNSSVERVQTETEYVPTETGHWQFISGACSNRNRVCSNRNWSLAIHQWSVFKQKQSMFQQKLVTGNSSVERVQTEALVWRFYFAVFCTCIVIIFSSLTLAGEVVTVPICLFPLNEWVSFQSPATDHCQTRGRTVTLLIWPTLKVIEGNFEKTSEIEVILVYLVYIHRFSLLNWTELKSLCSFFRDHANGSFAELLTMNDRSLCDKRAVELCDEDAAAKPCCSRSCRRWLKHCRSHLFCWRFQVMRLPITCWTSVPLRWRHCCTTFWVARSSTSKQVSCTQPWV